MSSPDREARGAALRLVLSSSLFAIMAVLAKLASRSVPATEAAFVRFATGLVVIGVMWAAGRADLRPRRWGWLFARGFFGGTAVVAYFSAMQRISVGEATLLNYTQPVFTMLGAWALLGERPPRRALLALPLTLVGVSLIVGLRPADLRADVGPVYGLLSAMLSGVAVTSIRAARRHVPGGPPPETAWSVFLSFTGLGLIVTLPAVLPPFGRWVTPPSLGVWALLLGVGISSVLAQLLMTEALLHLRVATAGIITQLTAVLTIGAGAVFLGDRLSPTFLTGALLTLAGVAMVVVVGSAPRLLSWRRPAPPA
ncbi:MAG TPA: DMT family transporter [Polyangia bacterium]|nr:DMT family transporter [Polyangia bacterium]